MFKRFALGAAMAVTTATAAHAGINIDGVRDAAYELTASVGYNPAAPESNFGSPTNQSKYQAYDIYLHGGAGYVYGFFEASGPTGLTFANLYFDLDTDSPFSGSDLGFELGVGAGNQRAFVPNFWMNPKAVLDDVLTAKSADGSKFEFAIPVKYFTSHITGLTYDAGVDLPNPGGTVRLNLSQSFGYSVAGGQSYYGNERLGVVNVVPEPSTWAMMILGFGAAGAMIRSRRRLARA